MTRCFIYIQLRIWIIRFLTDSEINIFDKVIAKFKDYKAKDIIEYMHDERAYMETKPGEIIPFSLAKEIKAF